MIRYRPVLFAVALLIGLVAACGPGDRTYVDTAGSATFDGRSYLSIAPERIDLGSAPLTDVGTVSFTNLAVLDVRAYAIAGIAPERALALRLVGGRPIALIPEDDARLGRPLGVFLPELCAFDTEPVVDACPPGGS